MSNNVWPLQSQCYAFYGDYRKAGWALWNLTTIVPPFTMTYDNKPASKITVHKKCAASLSRVFNAIWLASGKDQRKINEWGVSIFSGSYNPRMMRGSNHPSMHSWAIAIDLDAAKFPMGKSSNKFAAPVLKAFADEGWVNLPNDRMHFQAAIVG